MRLSIPAMDLMSTTPIAAIILLSSSMGVTMTLMPL